MSHSARILPLLPSMLPKGSRPLDQAAIATARMRMLCRLACCGVKSSPAPACRWMRLTRGLLVAELPEVAKTLVAVIRMVEGTFLVGDHRGEMLGHLVSNLDDVARTCRTLAQTIEDDHADAHQYHEIAPRLQAALLVVELLVLPLARRRLSARDQDRLNAGPGAVDLFS